MQSRMLLKFSYLIFPLQHILECELFFIIESMVLVDLFLKVLYLFTWEEKHWWLTCPNNRMDSVFKANTIYNLIHYIKSVVKYYNNWPADQYSFSVVWSQGFDPPHQSDTRTIYIANRFPQNGLYTPQKFIDNRIISSKVRVNNFLLNCI